MTESMKMPSRGMNEDANESIQYDVLTALEMKYIREFNAKLNSMTTFNDKFMEQNSVHSWSFQHAINIFQQNFIWDSILSIMIINRLCLSENKHLQSCFMSLLLPEDPLEVFLISKSEEFIGKEEGRGSLHRFGMNYHKNNNNNNNKKCYFSGNLIRCPFEELYMKDHNIVSYKYNNLSEYSIFFSAIEDVMSLYTTLGDHTCIGLAPNMLMKTFACIHVVRWHTVVQRTSTISEYYLTEYVENMESEYADVCVTVSDKCLKPIIEFRDRIVSPAITCALRYYLMQLCDDTHDRARSYNCYLYSYAALSIISYLQRKVCCDVLNCVMNQELYETCLRYCMKAYFNHTIPILLLDTLCLMIDLIIEKSEEFESISLQLSLLYCYSLLGFVVSVCPLPLTDHLRIRIENMMKLFGNYFLHWAKKSSPTTEKESADPTGYLLADSNDYFCVYPIATSYDHITSLTAYRARIFVSPNDGLERCRFTIKYEMEEVCECNCMELGLMTPLHTWIVVPSCQLLWKSFSSLSTIPSSNSTRNQLSTLKDILSTNGNKNDTQHIAEVPYNRLPLKNVDDSMDERLMVPITICHNIIYCYLAYGGDW